MWYYGVCVAVMGLCDYYGVYVAVMGSMWLLWGLCGCYGVKNALHGSYRTDLREGVTVAYLQIKICVACGAGKWIANVYFVII